MVNLATLDKLDNDWGDFLSIRHKYPLQKDILKRTNPKILSNFQVRLRDIIARTGEHIKNKAQIYNLIERLNPIEDSAAIRRYKKLANQLESIYSNARTQLAILT